jgi:hypothetical protein
MHMLTVVGKAERRRSPVTRGGLKRKGKRVLERALLRRGIIRREASWMGKFRRDVAADFRAEDGRERLDRRKIVGTPKVEMRRAGLRGEAFDMMAGFR